MIRKKIFVTLFMARSGSKFLKSLLNKHSNIYDFGECFHNRIASYSEEGDLVKAVGKIFLYPSERVGFQFRFPRHDKEFPEIKATLIENKSHIDVLFLMRKNKLKGAISQQNSEHIKKITGKVHLFENSNIGKQGLIKLDVNRAINEALDREKKDASYLAWAKKHFNVHVVYYEDLCDKQEMEITRILKFLNLPDFKDGVLLKSNLVKITSNDLKQVVSNYSELKSELDKIARLDFLDEVSLIKPKAYELFSEEFSCGNDDKFLLTIEKFALKTNTCLLEVSNGKSESKVISSVTEGVVVSDDNSKTWAGYDIGEGFKKCFTLKSKKHLLQKENGEIYRYDCGWQLLDIVKTGDFSWHGSWSIDQNLETGTIIWAEYPNTAERIFVWKSVDDGKSWSVCFEQKGKVGFPKKGDIRHFHLVQKCTTHSNRWYLASGDTEAQSKLWVSEDDGNTWSICEINRVVDKPDEINDSMLGRFHRFTSMVQTEDLIIFPTDDTFNGLGARVCAINKNNLNLIYVFEGDCGNNEMRNFIKLSSNYAVAISESKLDRKCVTVSVVNILEGKIVKNIFLLNSNEYKTNFANSISSKTAVNNQFYSLGDNRIFRPAPMTLRWTFKQL